jgi:hypothetical protein
LSGIRERRPSEMAGLAFRTETAAT